MENKCNKTPNNINNNNNTNSKYMDHMYCHTNQNKGYNNVAVGNASGGAGSPNDVLALLKENKQLKAMLILHLDLIQEQSDQLIAKDKLLVTQTEEIERLSARNTSLESQTQELQQQLQRQIKRSGELSTLPPPPLAKIQCKSNAASLAVTNNSTVTLLQTINNSAVSATTGVQQPNIIGECNGKLISKIILQRVSTPAKRLHSLRSPQSQTTDTENDEIEEEDEEDDMEEEEEEEEENPDNDEIMDDENNDDDDNCRNGENLFFEIERDQDTNESKTNTPAVEIEDFEDTGNSTEDSNEVLAVQSKRLRLRQAAKLSLTIPRGAKPSVSMAFTNKQQATYKALTSNAKIQSVSAPAPSRGKQMPLMRWHAPDFHTDESASCDSAAETEKRSISATPVSPSKPLVSVSETKHSYSVNLLSSTTHSQVPTRAKVKRSYLSTSQLYCAREWEDEAFAAENNYEFIKAEAKALDADAPMLEIPKWTEHELTPSYCIEGTEDLSDESFLKRHAKLEIDEKRRKKWDVQQIREQRRIERLKRRHCKDEIANNQETPMLQSFYPTSEAVQTICFMHDLPIQAFGEMIPRLGGNIERKDFYLPWLEKDVQLNAPNINKGDHVATFAAALANTSSTQLTQQQMLNSSFVFLKKRKRQQSSSVSITTTSRQRSLATKATSANSTHSCLQPFTATAGITSVHSDTINPISNSSTDATTISTISGTTSITTLSTVNELTN